MLPIICLLKSTKQYNICHLPQSSPIRQKKAPLLSPFGVKLQSYSYTPFCDVMIPQFETLSASDIELMLKAPVLVCILVAGADGTIDKQEIKQAIVHTRNRAGTAMAEYLREVSQDFEDKLKILLQAYPHNAAERALTISDELAQLNPVLSKMQRGFAAEVYQMLRGLALKIASSSGGILGMNAIDDEEAQFVQLSMIRDPSKG